jgi:4-amino-4-deoxy-L-arabinose transferase-like glycosyltransferase
MQTISSTMTRDRAVGDVSARTALFLVGLLVVVSFVVRMWVLEVAVSAGTFSAVDADGYLRNGIALASDDSGWRWTMRAVEYRWAGHMYYLPPLYPVFLSIFVLLFDSFVYWAAVGQAAINALSVVGLYVIGASIHSRRAGIIAALIHTFWLSSIWRYALFIQEQLYLPLLIVSFALLTRAMARDAGPSAFAWSGLAFGLAALTRSMPMYFIFPVAIVYVLTVRDRDTVRRGAALLGGFLAVTGSYSLFISWRLGRFMFIENHAGISIEEYGIQVARIPGSGDIAVQLLGALWRDPEGFLTIWSGYARALFHVNGDRWLHAYLAPTAEGAVIAKVVAHAGIDFPFIMCILLMPLGAVLAQRSREAALLFCWSATVIGLTALSATGGGRYRSPFEPTVIALASVVLAGGWRRPTRPFLVAAVCASVLAGSLVLTQIPRVAGARANYGLFGWAGAEVGWQASATGSAGFNLLPDSGSIELWLSAADPEAGPAQVAIRVDSDPIAERVVDKEPVRVRLLARHPGLHFIEVMATGAAGDPAKVAIEVRR